MPYSIAIDRARGVVRVTVAGVFEPPEAQAMTTEARGLAAESGMPILYDIRAASAGKLVSSDIFWWPRKIPVLKDSTATRVRVATVFVAAQRPIAQFWETAFRNAGLNARAFEDDEDAAIAWLVARS